MTFDEFNSKAFDLTEAYRKLVRWNESLRYELEKAQGIVSDLECDVAFFQAGEGVARRLAEEWRNRHCGGWDEEWTELPWEEK